MWGVLAILARFINSFVFMGATKALGVLIPGVVEHYGTSVGAIGFCASMFAGLPHVSGN